VNSGRPKAFPAVDARESLADGSELLAWFWNRRSGWSWRMPRDAGHDALMTLYRNRFAEQIELVKSEELMSL